MCIKIKSGKECIVSQRLYQERIVKITRNKSPAGQRSTGRLKKDGATSFQRIRQRQGCEEKQALCLYTVGRRRNHEANISCNGEQKVQIKNNYINLSRISVDVPRDTVLGSIIMVSIYEQYDKCNKFSKIINCVVGAIIFVTRRFTNLFIYSKHTCLIHCIASLRNVINIYK